MPFHSCLPPCRTSRIPSPASRHVSGKFRHARSSGVQCFDQRRPKWKHQHFGHGSKNSRRHRPERNLIHPPQRASVSRSKTTASLLNVPVQISGENPSDSLRHRTRNRRPGSIGCPPGKGIHYPKGWFPPITPLTHLIFTLPLLVSRPCSLLTFRPLLWYYFLESQQFPKN